MGPTWIILGVVAVFFSGIGMLYYKNQRPRLFVARSLDVAENREKGKKNIVSLTKDTILEHKN